jgi:hypothetical protein
VPLIPGRQTPGQFWQVPPPTPHWLCVVPGAQMAPVQHPVQQLPLLQSPPVHAVLSGFDVVAVHTSVAQLTAPYWHGFAGEQAPLQATQLPLPSHVCTPVQPVTCPMPRFELSAQIHVVPDRANAPVLHAVGFVVHACPMAHGTHVPLLQKPPLHATPRV